jgi:ADP-heptose:LPS heptosyltransferase
MTAEYKVQGDVAVITLMNPPVNGLGLSTRIGITDGLEKANNDAAVKAVVITGGGKERPQVQPLLDLASRNPRVIDLMGATDVAQLMAVIEGAALVVANDSAALHIGVGFDRPCVGLLGPTDPKLASPFGREGDIVQHVGPGDEFYFRDARSAGMMQRITLEEVIAACEKRLDNRH